MVTDAQLAYVAQDEERRDKVIDRRLSRRYPYKTEIGLDALTDIVKSSGFFDVIDSPEQTANRNFVVKIMEDMGLLDECHVREILRFMLGLEVFPGEGQAVGRARTIKKNKEEDVFDG